MTVLEILGTTDAAKATIGAVVGSFVVRHPQIANVAVVVPELNIAIDTVIPVRNNNKENRKRVRYGTFARCDTHTISAIAERTYVLLDCLVKHSRQITSLIANRSMLWCVSSQDVSMVVKLLGSDALRGYLRGTLLLTFGGNTGQSS
jgi:hypothetical protein